MFRKWVSAALLGCGLFAMGSSNLMAQGRNYYHHNNNRPYYGGSGYYNYNVYRPYYQPVVPVVIYPQVPFMDSFYGSGFTAPPSYRTGFSTPVPFDGFYGSGFTRSGVSVRIGF